MIWQIVGLVIAGLSLLLNVAVIAFIIPLRSKVEKIDRLKAEARSAAEQIIEAKLTGLASELQGVINVVNERVSNMRERLTAGDANFADLDQRDRELEARFNLRFDQLKDYVHKNFASRESVAAAHRRIDAMQHGAKAS